MKEIYLAPSKGPNGEEQLRIAQVRGESLLDLTDPAAAELIEREQAATGVQDAEAMAMQRLYSGQPIEQKLFEGLDRVVDTLDPAEELLGAVHAQTPDEEVGDPNNRYNVLSKVVDGNGVIGRGLIQFLTHTGLVVSYISDGPEHPLIEEYDSRLTDDAATTEAAIIFGLSHVAFECELVYGTPDEHGTKPELLSRRTHYALGSFSEDGEFEHMLTILHEDHPARQ